MKNTLLIFAFFALSLSAFSADNWNNAQWIWQTTDGPANGWVCFRKTINLASVPVNATANIAVDSKFWLWVNGEMVVFEGGMSHGPSRAGVWDRDNNFTPTNTWYEEVDITPYLKQGENTIAILAWYWGRETHKGSYIDSGKGGLLFSSSIGDENIVSNSTWKMKRHPAYAEDSGQNSTSIIPHNVKFDAQVGLGDWSSSAWYTSAYDDSSWEPAVEKGMAGSAPWYNLEINYVPRLVNHGLKEYENNAALNFPFVSTGNPITCKLPFNMQITPYFEIETTAGKVIEIETDNRMNRISANYTTKAGVQGFECFSWMNGHSVIYNIPAGVTVKALKYRWMSMGEMAGTFSISDPFYDRLWWMGRNTLFVCARDNFMDCPDRERALWIGDVADQSGYLFYTMDEAGHKLLKKDIFTTFNFSEDGVIGCLGPGRTREVPAQGLQFIAQLVWSYYFNTSDLATLEAVYPNVHAYLALWTMNANGLSNYRKWEHYNQFDWVDWGDFIDKNPIQTALYYMALETAKKIALEVGESTHIAWYDGRMNSIRNAFNTIYWKNGFYSSDVATYKDDRVNALAILSGIADSTKFDAIVKNVLVPNKFASPHFEWMVEAAMCETGNHAEALERMKSRYQTQVNTQGITTLSEYFPTGGSYNHAWNAPNTILNKYIAGIEPTKVGWSEYKVCPTLLHFTSVNAVIPSVKGDIAVDMNKTFNQYTLNLISPIQTIAIVGIPKKSFDIFELKAANQTIWKNGQYIGGVAGISWHGEDDDFILIKAEPGTWLFEASGNSYISIPTTIEAEDYNLGGEGDAYHDVDAIDQLGQGRAGEGVDVGILNDVKFVGFTETGEWLTYNINIGTSRTYDFLFDYVNNSNIGEISIWLNDSALISSHVFKQTAGLESFETDTIFGVMLNSGLYTLKLKVESGGFNLDKIHIVLPAPIQEPYHGTAIAIPGKFEAEDYDLGGQGKAYNDSDPTNISGGQYRINEGVDIGTGGSGYVIGNTNGGEWAEYTVDVEEDGEYDIDIFYSSGRPGGGAKIGFSLPDDNIELINSFGLSVTGGWSTFLQKNLGKVSLTQGEKVLRINVVERGFNLDWVEFKKVLGTGINKLLTNSLHIYPNPSANGQFSLSEYCNWELYNLLGKQVLKGEETLVDLSVFNKGMYILKANGTVVKLIYR